MAMLRSMIKSKSKRHPVLSKHCLVPEEDAGDTDGTEIYDPEDDEDTKKQRRPSKGSLSKRKGPPKGAAQGGDKKRPRKPRANSTNDGDASLTKGSASRNPAQYNSLMQELSIVVEPLAHEGPPKLEPLKASPAEAPPQSEPTQLPAERCEDVYQHTAELPALVANEKEEEEVTPTPRHAAQAVPEHGRATPTSAPCTQEAQVSSGTPQGSRGRQQRRGVVTRRGHFWVEGQQQQQCGPNHNNNGWWEQQQRQW
ncbi:hypothetical protein MTO96_004918 [Rhipicephalus appendiculatus]